MGRSVLEVNRNGQVSLHSSSVIRSTAARLKAAQGWKSAFFQRWRHWHSPSVVAAGSGFLGANQYAVEEVAGCRAPRRRRRRSLRKPYNLRMHATVGVGLAADMKRRRSPTARDTAR